MQLKTLLFFISLSFLIQIACIGQESKKVIISSQDPYNLYSDGESTTLFYETLIPKGKPVGALVILPGAGERIEDVKKQIKLHLLAVEKNLLVIFPSINWGTSKHQPEHQLLDTIFKQIISTYNIPKTNFVLGGFSGGAMVALTYTEKANKSKDSTIVIPKAVFGVDPPLDYAHLWEGCIRNIEKNISKMAVAESKWIIEQYTQEFGGSPKEFPKNYINYSIYSHEQKDGGNVKYLINTPILLYTEPDVLWQMKNRGRDYYDMNCLDISAMINFLQLKGNKEAQLVITSNRGKRLDGTKHPHSWSIMDSNYCLDWILKKLKS